MATKGTALRSLSRPHLRASTTALTGDRNIRLASATPAAGAAFVSSTLVAVIVAGIASRCEEGSGRATAARCGEPSATMGRTRQRAGDAASESTRSVLILKELMTSAPSGGELAVCVAWYTALQFSN